MSRILAIRDIETRELIWQAPPETPEEIAERERFLAELERHPRPLVRCGCEDAFVVNPPSHYQRGCGQSLPRDAIRSSLPLQVKHKGTRTYTSITSPDDLQPGDRLGQFTVTYTCPHCRKVGRFRTVDGGCRFSPGAWERAAATPQPPRPPARSRSPRRPPRVRGPRRSSAPGGSGRKRQP